MLVLDGKRIIRMTAEGIAYLDEEGFEHFIYFSECHENGLEWHEKQDRKVAGRDLHELYIEFYTKPMICFKFANQDEWWKLRKHIEKAGWRTRDMA
jgi:hypothetical protein